jgi:hypothetical protein
MSYSNLTPMSIQPEKERTMPALWPVSGRQDDLRAVRRDDKKVFR